MEAVACGNAPHAAGRVAATGLVIESLSGVVALSRGDRAKVAAGDEVNVE